MFEDSQAIHAHQQHSQVTVTTDSPQGSSGSQPSSVHAQSGASAQYGVQRQNSGGAITQDLLSSALAGAMSGSPQPSPLSSLTMSNRWGVAGEDCCVFSVCLSFFVCTV